MSKPLKVILWIAGVFAALVIGVLGVGVYYAANMWNGMRVTAENIYGGPIPDSFKPLVGMDFKTQKMAVLMEIKNPNMSVTLMQKPSSESSVSQPFSEKNLKTYTSALSSTNDSTLESLNQGKISTFKLAKQPVEILTGKAANGTVAEMAVLNLDKGQTEIVAEFKSADADNTRHFETFIKTMPSVTHDSHIAGLNQHHKLT